MKMKLSIALIGFAYALSLNAFTTLNYNDIFPPFTTKYHFDFMNDEDKEVLKEKDIKGIYERIQFSTSLIGQKATKARNLDKVSVLAGDVHGRLNMIGLTYGSVPNGQTEPALLANASTLTLYSLTGATVGNSAFSDENQNFGFFSLPVKYRKMAGRFKVSMRILDDFVVSFQGGVADMKQTVTLYINKTDNANFIDVYKGNSNASEANWDLGLDQSVINVNLMNQRQEIFTQMGVDGEDWQKTGAEDVSLSLVWRHNFRINKDEDPRDWARFIFTPHFIVAGTFGVGPASDPDILFSLPFGNNKHNALHFASGFSLDFYESLEVSFEAGTTHFFDRTYETRVPTSQYQSVLFPYKTSVKVEPGKTWHFSIGMNGYHFLDKLSVYALYSYVQHLTDTITLVTADSAFIPSRLEDQTLSKVQNARIGFNYDLSPNMTFGFLWQAPLAQRAAYKATTIALSAIMTF